LRILIELVENSNKTYYIVPVVKKGNKFVYKAKCTNDEPASEFYFNSPVPRIEFDPNDDTTVRGDNRNPRVGLAHELSHAWDFDKENIDWETVNGISKDEIRAVNMENRVREKTGDPKRSSYGGKEIPKKYLD